MTSFPTKKPERWDFDLGLVAPEYQWMLSRCVALVPFWERSGQPYDYIQKRFLTNAAGTGSNLGSVSKRGNVGETTDTTTNTVGWTYPDSAWVPTTKCTIVFSKKKTDGTDRAIFAYGMTEDPQNERIAIALPWSDGGIDCDFGGASGDNRLEVDGLTFGDDIFAIRFGTRGIAIWRNGIEIGSNSVAITRVATTTRDFGVGYGTGDFPDADLAQYSIFAMFDIEFPDPVLRRLSIDPFGLIRRDERKVFFVAAAPAGGRIMSSLAGPGGLANKGGIAGPGGGLAG